MHKSFRFWLAIGISVLFLGIFLSRLDLRDTWEHIGEANYFLLVPAIIVYFGSVYFRTLRWQYLLAPVKKLRVQRLYPVVVVGYMANNILPVRLGEVVRAYYVGERENVSKVSALATIAVERVFDGLTLLFFAAIVGAFLPLAGVLQGLADKAGVPWVLLALAMSLPFAGVLLFMVAAAMSPPWFVVLLDRTTGMLPGRIRDRVRGLINVFIAGLASLKDPRRLAVVFLLSLPVWLMEALMYYIVAFSFDLQNTFGLAELAGVILLVTAVSNLATSIPAAGGGVGAFEVAAAATLEVLGADASAAGAYTIVVHAALLLPVTLLGFVFLWAEKVSFGQLTRDSRMQASPLAYPAPGAEESR